MATTPSTSLDGWTVQNLTTVPVHNGRVPSPSAVDEATHPSATKGKTAQKPA